jgi:hypothetical protein
LTSEELVCLIYQLYDVIDEGYKREKEAIENLLATQGICIDRGLALAEARAKLAAIKEQATVHNAVSGDLVEALKKWRHQQWMTSLNYNAGKSLAEAFDKYMEAL